MRGSRFPTCQVCKLVATERRSCTIHEPPPSTVVSARVRRAEQPRPLARDHRRVLGEELRDDERGGGGGHRVGGGGGNAVNRMVETNILGVEFWSVNTDSQALTKALSPSLNRPIMPEWIEDILTITQDERLAAALVRPGGAVAFKPRPVAITHEALQGLAAMSGADASFVTSLHEGVADGVWEPHEVLQLEHCAARVIAELLGICAGARQAMEDAEGADHG